MSLSISVHHPETHKKMDLGAGKYMMGVESSRYNFWGHSVMVSLGLKILPQLGIGAFLRLQGNELDALEMESRKIQENAEYIVREINKPIYDLEFIAFRTDNLLLAIDKARLINGIVMIG